MKHHIHPQEELLGIYDNCIKSRYLDEQLQTYFHKRKGSEERLRTYFSAIGNEVGPSVVTFFLNKSDWLVPRYRGYAAVLGKGISLEKIVEEIFRKKGGASLGIGDSSSFKDLERRISPYSTILGTNFSIAIGIASAMKFRKESCVVTQFFGDGEASRPSFGSALNLAVLWKLPILFVCENNGMSIETNIDQMISANTVAAIAKGYGVESESMRETDVLQLLRWNRKNIESLRQNHRPLLLEITQTRFVSHSSSYDERPFRGDMIPQGQDPLLTLRGILRQDGVLETELNVRQRNICASIDGVIARAQKEESITYQDFMSIYHE